MHLNHLRHLVALAEHQSFRKAAEALFLTQPALSRSIQSLEQEMNVALFDRSGHRSLITPFGKALLGNAVGDEVQVEAPAGVLRYRILEIQK